MIGALQGKLNAVVKTGMNLKEKSDPGDGAVIEEKISELRTQWDEICALSVERYVFGRHMFDRPAFSFCSHYSPSSIISGNCFASLVINITNLFNRHS